MRSSVNVEQGGVEELATSEEEVAGEKIVKGGKWRYSTQCFKSVIYIFVHTV